MFEQCSSICAYVHKNAGSEIMPSSRKFNYGIICWEGGGGGGGVHQGWSHMFAWAIIFTMQNVCTKDVGSYIPFACWLSFSPQSMHFPIVRCVVTYTSQLAA